MKALLAPGGPFAGYQSRDMVPDDLGDWLSEWGLASPLPTHPRLRNRHGLLSAMVIGNTFDWDGNSEYGVSDRHLRVLLERRSYGFNNTDIAVTLAT